MNNQDPRCQLFSTKLLRMTCYCPGSWFWERTQSVAVWVQKHSDNRESCTASHSAGQVFGYGTDNTRQKQTLVFAPHHSFWYSQPDNITILAFCSDDHSLAFIVALTGVDIRPYEVPRKGLQPSGSCQHTVQWTQKGKYTESIYYWPAILYALVQQRAWACNAHACALTR